MLGRRTVDLQYEQMSARENEQDQSIQQRSGQKTASATVSFRVRCDKLGHGESINLVAASDHSIKRVSSCVGPMGRVAGL